MKRPIMNEALGEIKDDFIREAHDALPHRSVFTFKRFAVATVAACMVFGGTVTALAANDVDVAYRMVYAVSPYIAQQLKPIHKSSDSEGIRMEVVSASIQDDTAEILISIADLEEDRIDATTDLFDSYYIRNSSDSIGTCRLAEYDTESKTAYFLVMLQQMRGINYDNEIVTFGATEFLSQKEEFASVLDGLMEEVNFAPTTTSNVAFRGFSGEGQTDSPVALTPLTSPIMVPVGGVEISALGYAEGKLHVQVYYHDILKTDNHGYITLQAADGSLVMPEQSFSFWDIDQKGSYEEYVFEIPEQELDSYQVYAEFVTSGCLVEGDWEVTFHLADALNS